MAGRKTKLTAEIQELLLKGIRLGLTYKEAAQLAGIHEATFYRWKKMGEKAGSGIFYEFCESLKRANVEAMVFHLKRICDVALGGQKIIEEKIMFKRNNNTNDEIPIRRVRVTKYTLPVWQASAWILERRFPDRWGKRAKPRQNDEDDPLQE